MLSSLLTIPETQIFTFESFLTDTLNLILQKPLIPTIRSEGQCKFFLKGFCAKGNACQFSHSNTFQKPEKTIVCKHWLRGLCKKGDVCEFLHEYNMKRMPECWFFQKYGECSNPECLYLHIDPNSRGSICMWYVRGFCRHGPECKNRHVRKAVCQAYLTGFCSLGPDCSFGHPKFELPVLDSQPAYNNNVQPQHQSYGQGQINHEYQRGGDRPSHRPMENVTCFKCGENGHFANSCPQRRTTNAQYE